MTKNGKYLLMCAALTVALLLRYGFGLITPFLLGTALALSAEPVAKRLERYCGNVMESFAALEKQRNRFATKIQFAAVPSIKPIPIHT